MKSAEEQEQIYKIESVCETIFYQVMLAIAVGYHGLRNNARELSHPETKLTFC